MSFGQNLIRQRINHTVHTVITFPKGYIWVLIRHNIACTDKWSKDVIITCWIFRENEYFDSERIMKFKFTEYKKFKLFKDLIKKGAYL